VKQIKTEILFNHAIIDCNLISAKFTNSPHTWLNSHQDSRDLFAHMFPCNTKVENMLLFSLRVNKLHTLKRIVARGTVERRV